MKKNLLVLTVLAAIATTSFSAKAQDSENPAVYRRSSLCMILMDEANMPKRDTIRQAFLSSVLPDKYDDHNIEIRHFDPANYTISQADHDAFALASKTGDGEEEGGKKKKGGGFGKLMKEIGKEAVGGSATIDTSSKETYAVVANKHLLEQQVAKQLFDKWFRDADGNFTMDLIKERGKYDASVMDVQTAKSSTRGMAMLEDAGEELINNTFVVVNRYRYMSKDELVSEMEAVAAAVAGQFGFGNYAAIGGMAARAAMGAGYYVRTNSYLFQLRWNDEIANKFYSELWDNHEAYEASDLFSLKYIGNESAFANVKASIFSNKPEDELIRIATVNATDAVLAKLQKKYDVFKTKTPLLTAEPLTAHIGMKEDISAGDKYEVLEQVIDKETGKTKYVRKAVVRVAKGKIWDNRFMADEELAAEGKDQELTATHFEGTAKGLYPGMLLRQIK